MPGIANEYRPGTIAGEMFSFEDTAHDGRLEEFSIPVMMVAPNHLARLTPFQNTRQTLANLNKCLMVAFGCQRVAVISVFAILLWVLLARRDLGDQHFRHTIALD